MKKTPRDEINPHNLAGERGLVSMNGGRVSPYLKLLAVAAVTVTV